MELGLCECSKQKIFFFLFKFYYFFFHCHSFTISCVFVYNQHIATNGRKNCDLCLFVFCCFVYFCCCCCFLFVFCLFGCFFSFYRLLTNGYLKGRIWLAYGLNAGVKTCILKNLLFAYRYYKKPEDQWSCERSPDILAY